jgi:DNA modification methylase
VMKPGAIFYVAHADSEGFNFRGAVRDVGWRQVQCLIWVKDRFVMGRRDYHWRHEPILYGWKEGAGHLVLEDRTQDTVWEIPRPSRSEEHPTMKPVELVERAVRNSSAVGGRVLDVFGGSGTTLVACERRERVAYLVEIDPVYCDVIVERWQQFTGKKAERVAQEAESA